MRKKSKITMTKIGMQIKKFKKTDNAVVGIVAAFLIIGLIVAVISVLQTQYVPKWMKEKEADHMSQVADQFAQLKYSIDTHTVNKIENTPISTSVTLGSEEMPYLMSVRSFGQLDIIDGAGELTITNHTQSFDYSLGAIKYSSSNAYYIDQTYTYEYGAVILSQSDGNTVYVKPSISVQYEENVNINLTIANISTIGEKSDISGYGTYPIQTEFLSPGVSITITNISSISINTDYSNAWSSFLNSKLITAGLNYGGYGTDYSINTNGRKVTIEFTSVNIVNLQLNIVNIGAQIAPGWIENR